MNQKQRRAAEKMNRNNSVKSNGAFGSSEGEKNSRVIKEKKINTFSRYLKEGKNLDLLKSRKSFLSAVK